MIYRVLIDDTYRPELADGGYRQPAANAIGPLVGAAGGEITAGLSGVMWHFELPAPDFENRRARFYFTERGWRDVGRFVAAEGRRRGHVVQVIRRKNPADSQVVYRDALQVAILPRR